MEKVKEDATPSDRAADAGQELEAILDLQAESTLVEHRARWHVNAPLLYDFFLNASIECPALCVEWLPDVEEQMPRLVIGTNSDEQNEVIVCELRAEQEMSLSQDPWTSWECHGGDLSGFGLSDLSGFGLSPKEGHDSPFTFIKRLKHPTEVNRVAPCPHRPQLLATKASTGTVLLFDYEKEHDSDSCSYDAELKPAHSAAVDGFALSWNMIQKEVIVSGGNDGRCCVWDVSATPSSALLHDFVAHDGALCDAAFSRHDAHLLATVGDDRALHLWDLRGPCGGQRRRNSLATASEDQVLTVDWNHLSPHMLASAGKDRKVRIWDTRFFKNPVKDLVSHKGDVVVVRWAPPSDDQSPNRLASCSMDGRLNIWDLAAKDEHECEAKPSSAGGDKSKERIAPELLFQHTGHTAGISDFSWNLMDRNMLCSVDEDEVLQIWQPQRSFDHLSDSEVETDRRSPSEKRRRMS